MITGVVTDIDGKFSVNIPRGAQLKFSFVGYSEQVISPEGNDIKVALKEDANTMDEVVVNGFFTRSKQTYTGAARTVTSEQLLSISPNNVLQALSVLDPSIKINKNNAMGSNPNNIPDLVIRSTTSLATDNEAGLNAPLIVIDGVESTLQDLYDINMYDIERVDILKDASATALYGENAANGVIVIERKEWNRHQYVSDIHLLQISVLLTCQVMTYATHNKNWSWKDWPDYTTAATEAWIIPIMRNWLW